MTGPKTLAPLVVPPGRGRHYDMGRIRAEFKADGAETGNAVSISEWWMEPNTRGIGAHSHDPETEIFHVLEGTMTFLLGADWREAPQGTLIFVPAGVTHDFENRSDARAGVLNIFSGAFEAKMPEIVAWFEKHPPEVAT